LIRNGFLKLGGPATGYKESGGLRWVPVNGATPLPIVNFYFYMATFSAVFEGYAGVFNELL